MSRAFSSVQFTWQTFCACLPEGSMRKLWVSVKRAILATRSVWWKMDPFRVVTWAMQRCFQWALADVYMFQHMTPKTCHNTRKSCYGCFTIHNSTYSLVFKLPGIHLMTVFFWIFKKLRQTMVLPVSGGISCLCGWSLAKLWLIKSTWQGKMQGKKILFKKAS